MSYLNDYLKVIPKADADRIRENILQNQAVLEIQNLSDKEFQSLLERLVDEESVLTKVEDIGTKITAEPLNNFYTNAALDLGHLFPEQNAIEQAGENYDQVYQSHMEDLKREIEALEQKVLELEEKRRGGKGLVLKSYSFEPEKQNDWMELQNEETAYLFEDRDGSILDSAEIDRLYHTYFLSLKKMKEINALENEDGRTTARLEVLYESPYTVTSGNPSVVLDGNLDSFWVNVALKPNNQLDGVSISPKGRD